MKRCKKCGKVYPSQQILCPDCRILLEEMSHVEQEGQYRGGFSSSAKKESYANSPGAKDAKSFITDIFEDIQDGIQESIEGISSGISNGINDINNSMKNVRGGRHSGMLGGFFNSIFPKKRFTKTQIVQIKERRKGAEYSAGALVTFMMAAGGLFFMVAPGSLFQHIGAGICAAIFGVAGLGLMIKMKKTVKKWDMYESMIRWSGNTPLAFIAEKLGKSIDQVSTDLQEMITKNFLIGPGGDLVPYIDREHDLLVMTDYQSGMPLESVEEYLARIREKERVQKEAEERESRKTDHVYMIRTASEQVSDPAVKNSLVQLASSLSRIEKKLDRNPDLKSLPYIRKLETAYLPNTMKLIGVYMHGTTSEEVTQRVRDSLRICAEAFENIEERLYDADDLNTIVDLDVMEAMFRRDGLLDSDFEIE